MEAGALLGIPLALVRLLEPLIWQEFKENVLCKNQKSKINKAQDSICSFLKSKMNVELVYITLVGICQFYNDIETIATTNSVLIFNSNRQSRSLV